MGRVGSLLEEDTRREKPCTHAGAMVAHPECTLVGGYDSAPERRLQFAQRWGVETDYTSAEHFLRATAPQILSIATHPDSHHHLVALAARHRVAVIICEKPLADTYAHSRAIMKIARGSSSRIIVNHERRYATNWQRAQHNLHSGEYGRLLSVRATLCFGAHRSHARALWHDGTHIIDLVSFLTKGTLRRARCIGNLHSATSSLYIFARASQPGGGAIPCVIEVGAERDYLLFEIECALSSGRITIGNGYQRAEHSIESPHYHGFRSLNNTPYRTPRTTGYFIHTIHDAVRCAKDQHAAPRSSAADGHRVMKLLHTIGAVR